MSEKDKYPNHSHAAKDKRKRESEPEKRVEKIITGNVSTKKKSKFQDVFVGEDANNVKDYIIQDVIIPNIKMTIVDSVCDGIRMFFGQGRRNNGDGRRNSPSSRISYGSFYDRGYDRRDYPPRTRSNYSHDDVIFDSRGEAEDVLDRMDELIRRYGMVRVADLYDLVGITGHYTDNDYGWTNLRNASIQRVRDGYLLKMPKALPLD